MTTDPHSTVVVIDGNRGTAVLDEYFPYYQRPGTTDGLASYNVLEVHQRAGRTCPGTLTVMSGRSGRRQASCGLTAAMPICSTGGCDGHTTRQN